MATEDSANSLLEGAVNLLQQKNEELALSKLVRPTPRESYDYVVIGAGGGGCAVAARLSEDPNVTVALLEAGCDDRERLDIFQPSACGASLQLTDIDWKYRTVPQDKYGACLGLNDNVSFWPRGKTLGGSTSINYMQYIRGCKGDYDNWAENFGCKGWSGDECWPFFMKNEGNLVKDLDPKHHNAYGDWKVTEHVNEHPIVSAWKKSGENCGLAVNPDPNGETQIGVGKVHWTIDGEGKRCSSAQAFLRRAENRPNFDVITYAHVKKLIISESNVVEGVSFDFELPTGSREEKVVKVNKEAIVSGGSIGSAQILMLSGIGPKDELKEHGIQCKSDLPVGKNLQDHIMSKLEYYVNVPTTVAEDFEDPKHIADYLVNGTGLHSRTGVEQSAFFQTGVRPDIEKYGKPDVQIIGLVGSLRDADDLFAEFWNVNSEVSPANENPPSKYVMTYLPNLIQPESVGELKLKSSNPYDHPVIDPHYLEHPRDIKSLVEGTKQVIEMCATEPLKSYVVKPRDEPKCPFEFGTDEYCEWLARHYTMTVYHPVGTCKMGAENDRSAVVTPDLKVKGIANLRVADCAIMPTLSSGNTQAPAVMIGERAADFIKKSSRSRL